MYLTSDAFLLQGEFSGPSRLLAQAEVLWFRVQGLLIFNDPKEMHVTSPHPAALCCCDKVRC